MFFEGIHRFFEVSYLLRGQKSFNAFHVSNLLNQELVLRLSESSFICACLCRNLKHVVWDPSFSVRLFFGLAFEVTEPFPKQFRHGTFPFFQTCPDLAQFLLFLGIESRWVFVFLGHLRIHPLRAVQLIKKDNPFAQFICYFIGNVDVLFILQEVVQLICEFLPFSFFEMGSERGAALTTCHLFKGGTKMRGFGVWMVRKERWFRFVCLCEDPKNVLLLGSPIEGKRKGVS
mmetsp:Transcript_25548/g.64067  ORF Transcript_25548/g.64067 Transcript_25548/m.64067 type:complete len:231 (+) Transcript_25548:237-929(+)